MATPRCRPPLDRALHPCPRAGLVLSGLLDWHLFEEEDEWVVLNPQGSLDATGLSFKLEARHPPLASYQPQDYLRVLLDPAGRLFCLIESRAS